MNAFNRRWFLILLLFLGWSSLSADPLPLDLLGAMQLALRNNLSLQANRMETQKVAYMLDEARGYSWGKLGVEAQYLHMNSIISITSPPITIPFLHNAQLAVPPVEIAPQDLLHLRLKAGIPLYTGGKIPSAIRQAQYGLDAQRFFTGDLENDAAYRAGDLFLGCVLARKAWEVNQKAMDSYREHLSQAQKAYDRGLVARYDVIRAQASVAEQEKKLTQAGNQYDLALAALKSELLLERNSLVDLKGGFFETRESLTLEQALARVDGVPVLKALDHKIKSLEMACKVTAADGQPQVAAVGQMETLTKQIAQTDPKWFYGLEANFDLFDGGVRKAKISQNQMEAEKTLLERRQASEQLKLAVQSAYCDMDSAIQGLTASRKAKELAQESLRLADKRFQVGTGTGLEVLDANLSVMVAQIGEYQSLYQLDQAYLKLHRYLGDVQTAYREVQQ